MLSTEFAVTYVAAYSVHTQKNGFAMKKRRGWRSERRILDFRFDSRDRPLEAVLSTTALRDL